MIQKINIVSFGFIEKSIIERIIQIIQKQFNIEAEFFKEMPIPWISERDGQMKASDFLISEREILENNQAGAVLGITDMDLFMPDLNFVFGLANPEDKVAIVSLSRLKNKNLDIFNARIQKEVIHEIGHLFNINHCDNSKCVMSFSDNINDVDKKDRKLCSKCVKIMRKYA